MMTTIKRFGSSFEESLSQKGFRVMCCNNTRFGFPTIIWRSCTNIRYSQDVLRAYIREIDQKGLLDETPPSPHTLAPPSGVNPERWLESVASSPFDDIPPSFRSLNTPSDDSGAKEMVIREDNMKFPQSMKLERPQPETGRDGDARKQL